MPTTDLEIATPVQEEEAQLGDLGYKELAQIQCQTLIEQIRRILGSEPPGNEFRIKPHFHEQGTYYTVAFDHQTPEGEAYLKQVENVDLERWDAESKTKFGIP